MKSVDIPNMYHLWKWTWEMPGMWQGRRGCSLDDVLNESDDPLVLPEAPLAPRQWPVLIDIRVLQPKPDPALLLEENWRNRKLY